MLVHVCIGVHVCLVCVLYLCISTFQCVLACACAFPCRFTPVLVNVLSDDMLAGLIRLMSSCLSYDKNARPSIDQLIDTFDAMIRIEVALETATAAEKDKPPMKYH